MKRLESQLQMCKSNDEALKQIQKEKEELQVSKKKLGEEWDKIEAFKANIESKFEARVEDIEEEKRSALNEMQREIEMQNTLIEIKTQNLQKQSLQLKAQFDNNESQKLQI